MADISITPANCVKVAGATVANGIAGESITAGQAVYLKASDSKLWKADANDTSATAEVVGIALHAAAANQPLQYQTAGQLTIGATVAAAETYILSTTAGGIAPVADLASASYLTRIGYGTTTAIIMVDIRATGVTKA